MENKLCIENAISNEDFAQRLSCIFTPLSTHTDTHAHTDTNTHRHKHTHEHMLSSRTHYILENTFYSREHIICLRVHAAELVKFSVTES